MSHASFPAHGLCVKSNNSAALNKMAKLAIRTTILICPILISFVFIYLSYYIAIPTFKDFCFYLTTRVAYISCNGSMIARETSHLQFPKLNFNALYYLSLPSSIIYGLAFVRCSLLTYFFFWFLKTFFFLVVSFCSVSEIIKSQLCAISNNYFLKHYQYRRKVQSITFHMYFCCIL